MKSFRFRADLPHVEILSEGAMPLYDDGGKLVGGFTIVSGSKVIGFVSGSNYPAALKMEIGEDIYFTPIESIENKRAFVAHGILSEFSLGTSSVSVKGERNDKESFNGNQDI
jgi:hypothetical protein